jgi:hypothetical protein
MVIRFYFGMMFVEFLDLCSFLLKIGVFLNTSHVLGLRPSAL